MTIETLCADEEHISQFIETITCDWLSMSEEIGLFEIRCLCENKTPKSKRFFVEEIETVVDFVKRMNAKGFNIYMTINPIKMDAKIVLVKAATDEDIQRAHYSFADADDKKRRSRPKQSTQHRRARLYCNHRYDPTRALPSLLAAFQTLHSFEAMGGTAEEYS